MDFLELYAAVLSTLAVGWHIMVEVRRHRTNVVVRVAKGIKGPRLEIVNRSEHPIRVIAWGLKSSEGSVEIGFSSPLLDPGLIGQIPPRDAHSALVIENDILNVSAASIFQEPATLWARISTGETFTSAPVLCQDWAKWMSDGLREERSKGSDEETKRQATDQ